MPRTRKRRAKGAAPRRRFRTERDVRGDAVRVPAGASFPPVGKTIDVPPGALGPTLLSEFCVLYNPTPDEINALAALRPRMFIMSFITEGDPTNPPDMTKIKPSTYVVRPYWIANVAKRDLLNVVRQLIEPFIKEMLSVPGTRGKGE